MGVPGLGEDRAFCGVGGQAAQSLAETLPEGKRELVTNWDVFSPHRMISLALALAPALS